MSGPRLTPVQPPYDPDLAQMLERWMPPDSGLEPLALFRTLARNQNLAERMRPLGALILGRHALVPAPLREVMIHRTCGLTGAEYEWGVHAAAFGRALGLTDEQLYSTVHGGPSDDCWDSEQSLVMALADELHTSSSISEELWAPLTERFSAEQILELTATAGWYHVIAYVCNGARVELEPWAERFP